MTDKTRVLIVVFDALRPDMVNEASMPNLFAWSQTGVRYSRSRCVFPSETRVNQSSLITGCYPGRHGIVANQFVETTASPDRLFNTGDEDALRTGDQRLDGELLQVASLGERLAENGLTLATLSSGTPGGGRILHHRAESVGGFRLAMHRPDATVPPDALPAIEAGIGAIAKASIPSNDWLIWATDAWMQYIEPEVHADVGILWFCEPDSSYHYCGIGSDQNLGAIAEADRQFGRLLEFYREPMKRGEMQLITLSDHGQLGVDGEAVGIGAALQAAGLKVGPVPGPEVDVAISVDSAGGLFCRDHDDTIIGRVIDCLSAQPWCGAIASRDPAANPMGLSLADVGLNGPRAPDVAVVLKASDATGPHGLPGVTQHDAHYPVGGGIHGGLHPLELNNWLAMAGTMFKTGQQLDTPAGIVDVLPTVMKLFNAGDDLAIDGRVLSESLAVTRNSTNGNGSPPETTREFHGRGPWQLQTTRYGSSRYLDGLMKTD